LNKKVRRATNAALLPALLGLIGCSGDSSPAPSKTEGSRPRDEQQKAREFGGDASKAVPNKGVRP
jgi:hypothetical protein